MVGSESIGGKGKKEVLVNPENWDDMVKKYQEREDEQVKRQLEKKGVASPEDLEHVAKDALNKRALRSEHQTLKDRAVLVKPKSPEIESLRKQIDSEITTFTREVLKQKPSLSGHPALKGRVSAGSPEERLTEAGST